MPNLDFTGSDEAPERPTSADDVKVSLAVVAGGNPEDPVVVVDLAAARELPSPVFLNEREGASQMFDLAPNKPGGEIQLVRISQASSGRPGQQAEPAELARAEPARAEPAVEVHGDRSSVDGFIKLVSVHAAARKSLSRAPSFAFVNGRAGGGKGKEAIIIMKHILGDENVFDLNDLKKQNTTLDEVLVKVLSKQPESGSDPIGDSVVVIAAGGDGTVNWVMNSLIAVQDLIVDFVVVPLPYGTGNDLHRAFGWGSSAPSLSKLRELVKTTQTPDSAWTKGRALLDTWKLTCSNHKGKSNKMQNYFSIGLLADMAMGVDDFREKHPKLTKNREMMKTAYTGVGAKKILSSKNPRVGNYVQSLTIDGKDFPVPKTVKDIVVLNIPSMISGFSPWRTGKSKTGEGKLDAVDDGMVEVLFVTNLTSSLARFQWQKLRNSLPCCCEPPRHWAKTSALHQVAQGRSVRIEFKENRTSQMLAAQVDGEPWQFHTSGEVFEITPSASCPLRFGPSHKKGRVGVFGVSQMQK
mmetsp:Transcript_15624/g.26323  ORF Transcript_15624/g.26323 Transcript_15624/m.26323 type:complete len:524 (+) Transcript_15624:287-1858(+)|eukprot:CAMPEP_0198212060 /NCGR_PEP_ID=MMETSP1445-20131203/25498_1 /TAXON_ID=36898 /ORGANISM="Pyramimonas sp., Strain CCMP2087" /LENGTH=523 /DNA_ID=CAMNT_0043886435 /DNA_START=262 /DNA_END=1833 /DNA_ORIENTATION=-